MFVLERLTDDDITKIVTQAVERVSPTLQKEMSEFDHDDMEDIPSSQPEIEDSISHPPSSLPSAITASQPCPAYPHLTPKILSSIVSLSTGDARTALSLLELVLSSPPDADPDALLASLRQSVSTSYDRTGDSHYDMISALHKSVRGSQPSAALYWLARMLTAGEDPLYVARRMVVCASEDIGLADNHALPLVRLAASWMLRHRSCLVVPGHGDAAGMPGDRDAGVPHQPRASHLVPRRGPEVDACVSRVQSRGGGCEAGSDRSCASPVTQCTDKADEGARVRARLLLQSRLRVSLSC